MTEREPYLQQSRRPLASLAFVLPLVIAYEVGTWWFHVDFARHTETRILAFIWLRNAFAQVTATAALLPAASVVALLLAWHIYARHPNRLRPTVMPCMAGESLLWALPLLWVVSAMTGRPMLQATSPPPIDVHGWQAMVILGIGAGIYEELLFRLLGFLALHLILTDGLGLKPFAVVAIALPLSAALFAGYHYWGGLEPFAWPGFAFRLGAGLWLGAIYLWRGYGIAVGTHVAYDVFLVIG